MIKLTNIKKKYDLGGTEVEALKGVDLEINRGEFVTIMGPSGSGKSTLLHILGLLDVSSEGSFLLEGHPIDSLPDKELARIRNKHFGFIFQSFNLFPELNSLDNVIMPLMYSQVPRKDRKNLAIKLLTDVGLSHRIYHYPNMLSGGEQQRVAIARALANNPDVILADEPTGNLPSEKGSEIIEMLKELNRKGVTIIMVTHDNDLGRCGTRKISFTDGKLVSDESMVCC
ncbi:ABC transporter ATP-binding protein [Thiospirochaeta perfilievii]|uniref:ABC transporter ATP-binding protein n=1 Tax=Thiospirochaeta perfilievii TaxID=252967 RepID=A0A5C1QAD4_9SPIO|nr:ABC transporter ATP-binding protein [Thiospirochaeta perfilievii]QEN05093.1 ABC transporter ATP-binding protein [Thiospirochaeta perfilievii]